MTGGVPLSGAVGGLPGGVRISMDCALPRGRRLPRSVGTRLSSCVPSAPVSQPGPASFSGNARGGSSAVGEWAVEKASCKSDDGCDRLESEDVGRRSGLEL